jgi:hypothetical protein
MLCSWLDLCVNCLGGMWLLLTSGLSTLFIVESILCGRERAKGEKELLRR